MSTQPAPPVRHPPPRGDPAARAHALRIACAVLIAGFAALTALHAGETLAALCASIALGVRARRDRRSHLRSAAAWGVLAAGGGLWAIAQGGWTFEQTGLGRTPPSPSWLDVPFLPSSAALVGGLAMMVQTPAGRLSQLRAALEALFMATGLLLCGWLAVIGPVTASSSSSTLAQTVALAYPVLDAASARPSSW